MEENKDGIDLLVKALKLLNLIPRSGYGEAVIKFQYQNGKLVFTEDSFINKTKTQINVDVK